MHLPIQLAGVYFLRILKLVQSGKKALGGSHSVPSLVISRHAYCSSLFSPN